MLRAKFNTYQVGRCAMSHKRKGQSTGSWKGKRDKHESVDHNSARKSDGWIDMGKNTNSQRNQSRKTDANGLTAEERAVLKRDREWRERNGY